MSVSAARLAVGVMVAVSGAQAPAGQRGHGAGMVAHLTAVEVLDRAAASALAQPATIPRPDQFVY